MDRGIQGGKEGLGEGRKQGGGARVGEEAGKRGWG